MAGDGQSRCSRFKEWLKSPAFMVYFSHTLSAWGDRMWSFAVGLFLVQLSEDLRLVAVYGFTRGGSILLFGAVIGDWIDRNMRLRAVRISLFIQNTAVILSAILLCIMFTLESHIMKTWEGGLFTLFAILVIVIADIAALASVATKICVERDWVVVMCQGNKGKLASLNATVRRIDLTTAILAPAAVGQIMTYSETGTLPAHVVGAIFIACWNVVSMFLEYGLLYSVYRKVPELAVKRVKGEPEAVENKLTTPEKPTEMEPDLAGELETDNELNKSEEEATEEKMLPKVEKSEDQEKVEMADEEEYKSPYSATTAADEELDKSCFQLMFSKFIVLFTGWGIYMRQSVMLAGLGLAFLYMTVLGFDNVTVGYAFSQGYTESILGICMAIGSLMGILGTVGFTFLRKRIGVERTGLFGFSLEISCLTLCVVSIWTPGSPFIGYHDTSQKYTITTCELKPPQGNATVLPPIVVSGIVPVLPTSPENNTDFGRRRRRSVPFDSQHQYSYFINDDFSTAGMLQPIRMENIISFHDNQDVSVHGNSHVIVKRQANNVSLATTPEGSVDDSPPSVLALPFDASYNFSNASNEAGTFDNATHTCKTEVKGSLISVSLFIAGIITGRFGLWMADLSVTQLIQENVAEQERGVVNGVQSSLNMLLDMVKFLLVIVAPRPDTFAILIILSFSFVCCGGVFYALYSRKIRGHLFHFEKCVCCRAGPRTPKKDHTSLAVITAETPNASTSTVVT
ncbi:solute carrier family 40 member 1 [Lingula anatina]|uniref:Solute carrier family 40 member 1 n=1 Tax=Lingula anatina TaxID=7574 RepID=A0A1S3HUF4_LINAN|nr:solute carrier family 40 member 1 [Lingula anatina]XP_013389676.1 solute carrier family 40 member 1 [Lingula anatina]XP_013389677.1 solute carrier family 40 member 1 [Lingula anatina]XP_013389678.1 solute carrier family 40 member 1 [Lingula anatina]|eukprot:XP_013389675.1 solute carrier family 40 member 1 [Lingula anatina]